MYMIHQRPNNGIISCPGCKAQLRLPEGIGGMAMACPECGQSMGTPFKVKTNSNQRPAGASAPTPGPQSIACLISRIKTLV